MADDREPPALFDDGDESGDEENDKEDLFTALSQVRALLFQVYFV